MVPYNASAWDNAACQRHMIMQQCAAAPVGGAYDQHLPPVLEPVQQRQQHTHHAGKDLVGAAGPAGSQAMQATAVRQAAWKTCRRQTREGSEQRAGSGDLMRWAHL